MWDDCLLNPGHPHKHFGSQGAPSRPSDSQHFLSAPSSGGGPGWWFAGCLEGCRCRRSRQLRSPPDCPTVPGSRHLSPDILPAAARKTGLWESDGRFYPQLVSRPQKNASHEHQKQFQKRISRLIVKHRGRAVRRVLKTKMPSGPTPA